MDAGRWTLKCSLVAGRLYIATELWKLDAGRWTLVRSLDSGLWTLVCRHWTLDTGRLSDDNKKCPIDSPFYVACDTQRFFVDNLAT